jgi:hydroxymethylglutaryl-CoA synthase
MNVSRDVGNLYTGSMYGALISLITFTDVKELEGKRILSYSYGSGLCSTLFSLTVRDAEGVSSIREKVNLIEKLADRIQVSVDQYRELMTERESGPLTQPDLHKDLVSKGAYFISRFDDKKRRFYSQNV